MKVLITDYQWPNLNIENQILASADIELVMPDSTDEYALVEAARGCKAIMTCWAQTTAPVIDACDDCQLVARMGIGLDNIDVEHCTKNGIPVTNVPDYCVVEVAEHVLASMMTLSRQIAFFHLQTKAGVYDLSVAKTFRRMQGQTLGIIGLGNIGCYLAKIAQGVGLNVVGTSRNEKSIDGVKWVALDELLATSDYVSLNAPLTEETRNLIDKDALGKMKPSAYLINTARGGLVDHGALSTALENDEIAGAVLDVQVPEPPDLGQMPYSDSRVIVTPHAAFVSDESLADLRRRAAQQVVDRLTGKTPESIVNGIGNKS